jgi:TatD DNase family protein
MIDTHCHLAAGPLAGRLDDVLAGAAEAGVDRMVCIGTTPADSAAAAELAAGQPQVFATVGVHPLHAADDGVLEAIGSLLELWGRPGVVAWGEMGLDQHYDDPPIQTQSLVFAAQLAQIKDRPGGIVIHNRQATSLTLGILRDHDIPGERCVFHCFTGSARELDAILDYGAMVGLTGIVTFKKSGPLAEASDRIPLDRLLIETDAPFLTPEPHRKVRPNEPRYVADVARFLAKRRKMGLNDFVAAVDGNAERFYGLDPASRRL